MSMVKTSMAFKDYSLKFAMSTVSDSLINRARNNLIAKFIANPEFTHIMFIDADIGWDPTDIIKLLWHDKDIMTASYPIKSINWPAVEKLIQKGTPHSEVMSKSLRYVVNAVKGRKGAVEIDNGAMRIYDAGTGFMLIKREVILSMFDNYPELKFNDDTGSLSAEEKKYTYALFNSYVDDDGRFLSEDYGFCRYWQKMGGSIWVDPTIEMTHIGRMKYTGRMMDFLQRVVEVAE